jgi:hypothetical protein
MTVLPSTHANRDRRSGSSRRVGLRQLKRQHWPGDHFVRIDRRYPGRVVPDRGS